MGAIPWQASRVPPTHREGPPIGAALLLHGLWDYAAFAGVFYVGWLVGLCAIIMVILVGRWSNRDLRPWMSDLLAPEVAEGLVTDEELTAIMGSPRDRRHLVKAAKTAHGKQAGKATRHVLDAQLDLAEALIDGEGSMTEEVEHTRSELIRLRGTLVAAEAS